MIPKSIKKITPNDIQIIWNDGHESVYPITYLRDLCPCAGCAGETVLLHQYVPPPPDRLTPGRYELISIVPVGSYAVQISWGDGHNTGIYTWEHLFNICPCKLHQTKH